MKIIRLFCVLLCCINCKTAVDYKSTHIVNVVGELFPDENRNDTSFKLCNSQKSVIQYYAFNEKTYQGEKQKITATFVQKYKPVKHNKQSGWIRIRFIVNCKGETGRFTVLEMDKNYHSTMFETSISEQLLEITKSLTQWKPMEIKNYPVDYYQYLLFKVENGELLEIMP